VTVWELVGLLGGKLLNDGADREVSWVGAAGGGADQAVLIFADTVTTAEKAVRCGAGAAVVPEGFVPSDDVWTAVIAARQPRLWFAKAARLLAKPLPITGVDSSAEVARDARLGEGVSIGPCAVIGAGAVIGSFSRVEAGAVIGEGVAIGDHCRIYPRAVLYPRVTVGDRVVIHAGAVLGADGFGYVRDKETGVYTQFPQVGRLVIEDDVEIGANTTIDRGALDETRIRRGVKIDNLVHVGHNCDIGEDVVIASLTGISGSSTVGKGAVLAGQVGIGDHAHVGAGVILGGQAGVLSGKTVETTGTVLWGTPAKPLREYLRELATLSRLARRKKE
jgi:UDP-3-O-[3-hydroxymyristoyl] glucosamine N-acyltransferase